MRNGHSRAFLRPETLQPARFLPICVSHTHEGASTTSPCVFCELDEARAEVKRLREQDEALMRRLVQAEELLGKARAMVADVACKLM